MGRRSTALGSYCKGVWLGTHVIYESEERSAKHSRHGVDIYASAGGGSYGCHCIDLSHEEARRLRGLLNEWYPDG